MSSIKRLWAVVSIIAILRPSLINSLPQDSLWSYYNRDHDNVAPVANANLLNGKDGKYGDTSSTPQDTGSDTILASNTGRLVSNKDGFPIFVNTEHSAANCQRKTDLESGALSGRAVPEECDATDGNGASPTTEAERDFVDCPEPWIWHLCGWGPASSFGRVDILDWPIHRTWVNNVWPVDEIECEGTKFKVCCVYYRDSGATGVLKNAGRNCLIIRGETERALLEGRPPPPN